MVLSSLGEQLTYSSFRIVPVLKRGIPGPSKTESGGESWRRAAA